MISNWLHPTDLDTFLFQICLVESFKELWQTFKNILRTYNGGDITKRQPKQKKNHVCVYIFLKKKNRTPNGLWIEKIMSKNHPKESLCWASLFVKEALCDVHVTVKNKSQSSQTKRFVLCDHGNWLGRVCIWDECDYHFATVRKPTTDSSRMSPLLSRSTSSYQNDGWGEG